MPLFTQQQNILTLVHKVDVLSPNKPQAHDTWSVSNGQNAKSLYAQMWRCLEGKNTVILFLLHSFVILIRACHALIHSSIRLFVHRLSTCDSHLLICRAGHNRIYTPYMTVYLVISLPKMPYTHRICMVLANPTHYPCSSLLYSVLMICS
jgi:hypothetical protein